MKEIKTALIIFIWGIWIFVLLASISGHGLYGTAAFFVGWYLYRLILIFGGDTFMEAVKNVFTKYVFLSLMVEVFAWSGAILMGIPIQLAITLTQPLTFFERMVAFPGFWIFYYMVSYFTLGSIPGKWRDDYRKSK